MTKTVKVGPYTLYADDGDGADPTGLKVLQHGIAYEHHIRKLLEKFIPDSIGFLDLGSNVGIHSVSAKSIRPEVPVVAIDASIFNTTLLDQTVHDNRIAGLTVLNYALSDKVGTLTMHGDKRNRWLKHIDRPSPTGEEVTVMPLDVIVDQPFDLVKMDVEGSELHVLKGATKLLEMRPIIIFEYSIPALQGAGVNPPELFDYLLCHGYTLKSLKSHPGLEERSFHDAQELHDYIEAHTVIADVLAECFT